MDERKLKKKVEKLFNNEGNVGIANLDVSIDIEDALLGIKSNLEERTSEIALEVEASEIERVFSSVLGERESKHTKEVVSVLREIRDKQPDKVEPPVVNVDTENIADSVKGLHTTTKEIKDLLSVKEEFEPVQVYDKNGKLVDWEKLMRQQNQSTAGMFDLDIVNNTKGVAPLSSTGTNGTRDLTSANTWYAVPSTVPTQPYILVATVETSVGTVRFAFDNTGTPSTTNGNQAPSQLTVRLAAGQVVYFASSTAGDDVNWTCKVI